MTQEGRVVTDCDLHAVTIGTGEQIKNKGSQFDVASFKGRVKSFVEGITGFIRGGGAAHTEQEATPEGVPEGYEYIPPDEEPPEDHDVVESDRGATYISPEPVDDSSEMNSLSDIHERFNEFGDSQDRTNVSEAFNEWGAWAMSEDTTPLWDAARDKTGNDNIPNGPGLGSFLGDPQPEKQESIEKHDEFLTNVIEEEYGEEITAHRILHGDVAETLRDGGNVEPRALASWTTSDEALDEVVAQTGADTDEDLSDSVVVTMDVPADFVFGIHTLNENLDARGQDELIAALPENKDLSDGDIRDATDVLE